MKKNNIDIAIMHCYRQLYAYSTPPASFDELFNNAEINEMGQKVIPYMDYEIDEKVFDEIVEDTIKIYKIKERGFRPSILLGCSPRFTKTK
jgi:hypothetical protein